MQISLAFGSRSTAVDNEEYASTFNMPELWDRLGANCNDRGTSCLTKFCDRIRKDTDMLSGLQHHSCPRARNQISDFVTKTARSFHKELHFIDYSIPVWLPKPPQV